MDEAGKRLPFGRPAGDWPLGHGANCGIIIKTLQGPVPGLNRPRGGTAMKERIIIILVIAAYLALSFLTNGWAWTWILWVVYAIYRASK